MNSNCAIISKICYFRPVSYCVDNIVIMLWFTQSKIPVFKTLRSSTDPEFFDFVESSRAITVVPGIDIVARYSIISVAGPVKFSPSMRSPEI